jgi:DNA sulfur modification protein DndE
LPRQATEQVHGGEASELYQALLKERCARDGLGTAEVLGRQLRLHLHRGIGYLATPHAIRSVADLIRLAVEGAPAGGSEPTAGLDAADG